MDECPQYSYPLAESQEPREISLGNGLACLVDAADYEWAKQYRWKAFDPGGKGHHVYAVVYTFMHRELMDMQSYGGMQVDHRNGNTLDNTRDNLRICTVAQNNANRGPLPSNSSGFKGVSVKRSHHPKGRPFEARITHNNKSITIGYFSTAEQAARAYDTIALRLQGEFAWVNFPEEVVW